MDNREKKQRRRRIIWLSLLGVIVLLVLLNGTRMFYFETDQYRKNDLSQIMDKRALPLEYRMGNKKAVLCVHGFPASPAGFAWQAEQFKKAGYDVFVPLLPGFGTRPEDLKGQGFKSWYAYLKDYYSALRGQYDQFYIIGMSMGGALTLKLAEEYSSDAGLAPSAIATVSAPVFLNSLLENGVLLNPALYISRTLSWIMPDPLPYANDVSGLPDGGDRWMGYFALLLPQIHSFKMGLKSVKKDLPKITVPYLGLQAIGDKDVPFKNLDYIYRHISSREKVKKEFDIANIAHSHHVLIMYDSTRQEVFDNINSFFKNH